MRLSKHGILFCATIAIVVEAVGTAIVYAEGASAPAFISHVLDKGGGKRDKVAYSRVDIPAGYRLTIRLPKPFALASLPEKNACHGFAMTGGYTSISEAVPDGLIVVAGRVRGKDNRRKDGGIVQIQGVSVALRRASLPRTAISVGTDQIYSQPILVWNGSVDGTFRNGKANRVALGKYQDGGLFMIMAYNTDSNGMSAVTLTEFANDVIKLSPKKIEWLVNFDGGPSAFLASPARSITFTNGSVTSYLCAEPTMADNGSSSSVEDNDLSTPSGRREVGKSIFALTMGAKEEVWAAILRGSIALVGGYLAAIVITPAQLYHWIHLRGADSYVGTWFGQIDGQYAEMNIDTESLDDNGKTVHIRGQLTWRGNKLAAEGGADGSVNLHADVKDHELTISLDRTQGEPGTPQQKEVQLLAIKPGQGARLCRKVVDLANPGPEICTPYAGLTSFAAKFS